MFEELEEELWDEEESLLAGAGGLAPPRQSADWYGDPGLEQNLLSLMISGKAPHALIFAGPEGVGKSTMAYRLARFLLAGKADMAAEEESGGLFGEELPPAPAPENLYIAPDDPVFKRVVSGGHADFFVVEKQYDDKKNRIKDSVAVEDVRKVAPFLRMKASHAGGWRVVIIDDADTMTRSAQNAILKILEEPPEKTLLILIAHRPGALLPTIHSRSRVVAFPPLTRAQFGTMILKHDTGVSAEDADMLFAVSGGSAGRAFHMMEEGGLDVVRQVIGLIEGWPAWDWVTIHKLAEKTGLNGQEPAQRAYQDVFLWVCEQVLRAKARGENLTAPLNEAVFTRMKDHYSLEEWLEICENLKEHFARVQYASLDKKLIVLGSFMVFNRIDKLKAAA